MDIAEQIPPAPCKRPAFFARIGFAIAIAQRAAAAARPQGDIVIITNTAAYRWADLHAFRYGGIHGAELGLFTTICRQIAARERADQYYAAVRQPPAGHFGEILSLSKAAAAADAAGLSAFQPPCTFQRSRRRSRAMHGSPPCYFSTMIRRCCAGLLRSPATAADDIITALFSLYLRMPAL